MHATPRSFSGQISLGKYGSPYLSFRNSHCMSHSATSSDVNKCVEVFFFFFLNPALMFSNEYVKFLFYSASVTIPESP